MMFDTENASATGAELGIAGLAGDAARAFLLHSRRDDWPGRHPAGRSGFGEFRGQVVLVEADKNAGFEIPVADKSGMLSLW
jgi:hypothetical protein